MSWTKTISINVVFLVMMLAVIEFIAAGLFYIHNGYLVYGKPTDQVVFINKHLSKHFIANSVLELKKYPNYNGDLIINKSGFIETINENEKNEKKLILIGGSTVEGRGASSNKTTIASFLSECLSVNSYPYYVLNAGRSGLYSYTEYRLLLESFLPKVQPDLVVSLNGRNDFHFSLENNEKNFYYHSDVNNFKQLIRQDLVGLSFLDYVHDFYKRTHASRVIASLSKRLSKKINPQVYENFVDLDIPAMQVRAENSARQFVAQIEITKKISNAFGASYLHFFQPTLMYDDRQLTQVEESFIEDWNMRSKLGSKYGEELNFFYDNVKLLSKDASIDLSSIFRNLDSQQLYVDSVHYNDKANKMIGYSICSEIINQQR